MSEETLIHKGANAISALSGLFFDSGSVNKSSLVCDERMIALGDTLQGLLKGSKIEIPKIVVVGTQSSGKSSVLNSLIGMDILPTGKQMVTRTPLHLEVVHSHQVNTESYAEFGLYENGLWVPEFTQKISFPVPTDIEKNSISEYIENDTCKKAGKKKDISSVTINLRIVSPFVSNLSFIDLPGLTAVACTDQGQPADIKIKIERLIGEFISKESTLILGVLPGRSDLEADMGLELIKKYDPTGARTVGVLTKLDLMNDPTDILPYLENKVSRDLQLQHGYFAVKNRNSIQKETLSVEEGLDLEAEYFNKSKILSKQTIKDNVGIPSLKKYLAHVLTTAMKISLPNIQSEINKELNDINFKLDNLGDELPDGDEKKISYLHALVVNFSKEYNSCINYRGSNDSTGRDLRDQFIKCRQKLQKTNPFRDSTKIKDQLLLEIIKNSEGNHMSFPYPPVEILERCLQDDNISAIQDLIKPINECREEITKILVKLTNSLIENSEINRFPELKSVINTETVQKVILVASSECDFKLNQFIDMQRNYIWTECIEFKKGLLEFGKEDYNGNIVPSLRELLAKYLDSIIKHLEDIIPKSIMYYLVKKTTDTLYSTIYIKINTKKVNELLLEDNSVNKQRQELTTLRKELLAANETLQNLL